MKTSRLVLTIALCAAPTLLAQEYRIQMQRATKAGQQFELSCRYQETHRVSAAFAGRVSPEQKTNYVAELDGLVKVLETDTNGRITKASCTISNCVRIEDKYRRELLAQQTVVMATASGNLPQLLVKGKPVDLETQKILAAAIQMKDAGPTPEQMFGTDKPRKVGESWDINPEPMVGVLRMVHMGATDADIQGRTTLEQIVKVGDEDCLELASKVYLKKFTPPLPPGVHIKQSFGAIRVTGKFPLDTSLAALEEGMEMDVTFVAEVKTGANAIAVTSKTASTVKVTLQRKYLK